MTTPKLQEFRTDAHIYINYSSVDAVIATLQRERKRLKKLGYSNLLFREVNTYDDTELKIFGNRIETQAEADLRGEKEAQQAADRKDHQRKEYERLRRIFEKEGK